MKPKILSTKKLHPSVLEKAKMNQLDIIEQEFIAIEPVVDLKISEQIIGLAQRGVLHIVITSQHAVEILSKYMHVEDTYYVIDWKIFCLSGKTKEAIVANEKIDGIIVDEAQYASDLTKKISAHKTTEVIFFCGDKRRDELPDSLRENGVKVHEIVLYKTHEVPQVAETDLDGILFFSPSAVQSFFSVNQIERKTVCFAIGNTTAESIADFTDNKVIISESPNQDAVLAAARFYFENINCYE